MDDNIQHKLYDEKLILSRWDNAIRIRNIIDNSSQRQPMSMILNRILTIYFSVTYKVDI